MTGEQFAGQTSKKLVPRSESQCRATHVRNPGHTGRACPEWRVQEQGDGLCSGAEEKGPDFMAQ